MRWHELPGQEIPPEPPDRDPDPEPPPPPLDPLHPWGPVHRGRWLGWGRWDH